MFQRVSVYNGSLFTSGNGLYDSITVQVGVTTGDTGIPGHQFGGRVIGSIKIVMCSRDLIQVRVNLTACGGETL